MPATEQPLGHSVPDTADALRVAIIVGSTRPGRRAGEVARWVHAVAAERPDAAFEVLDLADFALPLLDEPVPPMAGQYTQPHTQAWAAAVASFDAFVFVTPEYNHSTSAALKNAIDFLWAEWNDKAAAMVTYGVDGGLRAAEHLRLVLGELKVADVRRSVAFSFGTDFEGFGAFTPADPRRQDVDDMLDELIPWAAALRSVRGPAPVA